MIVNKYSSRMCEKIKKYVKILLLDFLNEDHILHYFLVFKEFFDKLYFVSILCNMYSLKIVFAYSFSDIPRLK